MGPSLCRGQPPLPWPSSVARPTPGLTHLQRQLVSEEGADEVAGVSSDPAQKEPQRQRLVHVACPAGLDVLAAAKEEEDAGSGREGARAGEAGKSPVSPSCRQAGAAGAFRCPLGILTSGFSSNQGTLWQVHLSRVIHSIPQIPLQSTLESSSGDLEFVSPHPPPPAVLQEESHVTGTLHSFFYGGEAGGGAVKGRCWWQGATAWRCPISRSG